MKLARIMVVIPVGLVSNILKENTLSFVKIHGKSVFFAASSEKIA